MTSRRETWLEAEVESEGDARATASAPNGGEDRAQLRFADLLSLSVSGMSARPVRAILSALGIAIGIAAMVAVLGISTSSQAKLQQQLDSLGTNMLTVEGGKNLFGQDSPLAEDAVSRMERVKGVDEAASVGDLTSVFVYRNSFISPSQTGGIQVRAAHDKLLDVTGASLRSGVWFNEATGSYPSVVLGSETAKRLGIESPGSQVWLGDQWFTVIGILDPVPLAPELDSSALVGESVAAERLGYDRAPTRVFLRADDSLIDETRELIPGTLNPQTPEGVSVSRPSDALAAKDAADEAFTGLLLGLGSLGLLIGGIGVANTMIISVMERRREIGLRRAIGARRVHIMRQFLGEALLLSALGGLAGALLGIAATAVYALSNGWPIAVPWLVPVAAVGATLVVGAVAGIYPALRAAKVSPTVALSG
ncbi:ABC transporter permease [Leucobacter sp. UT-8R-CII-1-4]|uniref:ABC transporter permease n=1 Tax=Leucobacter sp. UT-8R-CII-1-4 TaxID=3040075 RepID=UPI0024A9C8C8|nr:ABC transporter permease [Leucobacter sp. UT-8R-CII-1-4]MDI6023368.1 ABC transporter permease [Leucobacter sp. UT-8R-CII-1-4]